MNSAAVMEHQEQLRGSSAAADPGVDAGVADAAPPAAAGPKLVNPTPPECDMHTPSPLPQVHGCD